jgi:hypothetical protein
MWILKYVNNNIDSKHAGIMDGDVIRNCYISCACNRTPNCVDWGCNGLVCFGASHAVVIYDIQVYFMFRPSSFIVSDIGCFKRYSRVS